jgi:putative DNA-invertase from lambdoid prophage Rac
LVQSDGVGDRGRNVAIYCRVSTSDQDNDRQERDLKEYADRAGYEVVGVLKETLSGIRKAKGKQPIERGKVVALARGRNVDAVLVTEMTRWIARELDLSKTTVNEILKRTRLQEGG